MYIDKITVNEPLDGGIKEFRVFDEKKYDKLIKKNNNKLLNAVLFLTSNGEYTTTTIWPVDETGNHLITDSTGVKAVTSWDAENSYRKIIYNRDPVIYIEATGAGTIVLNGETYEIVRGSNYFEIDELTNDCKFDNSVIKVLTIRCKLPSSLQTILTNNKSTRVELNIDDSVDDLSNLLTGNTTIETLNTIEWDTSNVKNMDHAFNGATFAPTYDFTKLDTSKVLSMNFAFANNTGEIGYTNIEDLDTSNVKYMTGIFSGCTDMETITCDDWDTSNVLNMNYAFSKTHLLTYMDISAWNTSKVEDMSYMFNESNYNGDFSSWDTSNVKNMKFMFYDSNINAFDGNQWNTSKVETMQGMFARATNLERLDLSAWDTSNVTNIRNIFGDCESLEELNVSTWDTSKILDMSWAFNGCGSLQSLDLTNWDPSNALYGFNGMFSNCGSLTSLKFPQMGKCPGSFINFSDSPLDHDSLMSIFTYDRRSAGLGTMEVTLNATSTALLTSDEIDAITAKGYTIA